MTSTDQLEASASPLPRHRRQPGATRSVLGKPDLWGCLAVVAGAVVYLLPALWKGTAFGPYDLGASVSGLGQGLFTHVHNGLNGDQVQELIPWNSLDWRLVHHGQFPLWNRYTALGLPEFFNFQSSVLSLPDLVSYLVPLKQAFITAVAVKLVIAGTGAYVFTRVLGAGAAGATFSGLVFELSGPFSAELGWPISDVLAWTGWILAFAWLIYRRPRTSWHVLGLGVSIAFMIYGGFPEGIALVAIPVALVLLGALAIDLLHHRRPRWRSIAGLGGGLIVGVGLAAPLLLPGLQLVSESSRSQQAFTLGLPLHTLASLIDPGYFGYPLDGSLWFGPGSTNFYESAAYVGIFTLALATAGFLGAFRTKRAPGAAGLALAGVVLAGLSWQFGLFQSIVNAIPHLNTIDFTRSRLPLAFVIAILAGLGLDHLLKRPSGRQLLGLAAGAIFFIAALAILGIRFAVSSGSLDAFDVALRARSFLWPSIIAIGTAAVLALLVWQLRRPRKRVASTALGAMVALQVVVLVVTGGKIQSYGHQMFPETRAEHQLISIVGHKSVGLWTERPLEQIPSVGIVPEMNIGYRLNEFAIYDPMIPRSYFSSWASQVKQPVGSGPFFDPSITTAHVAQLYGTAFILVQPSLVPATPPPGMNVAAVVGGETLYKVRGVHLATLAGAGTVTRRTSPANGTYRFRVRSASATKMDVRLTDVPGWHATVDGHPIPVRPWRDVMLQLAVPAGSHAVVLTYWPRTFSDGLAVAGLTVLCILAFGSYAFLRKRHDHRAHETVGTSR